jgi:hypothetical protein
LTDLANKKNTELVEICAKLGLKKSGNKDDLIKRILLPVEERSSKGNRARKTTPKTANPTNPTITSEYLSTLTCKQLKDKCEALNMVLKGNKTDLIARLLLPEHLRPIKHSKSKSDTKSVTASVKTELKTEDTGKIFEKAICLAYNTPYEGNYKYSIEEAEVLAKKLTALCELYPSYTHTGDKKGRYDFTSADGNTHLSAKTIKKGVGKVAPQVIGQASLTSYCDIVGITYSSDIELKRYMQENIVTLLPMFEGYTFDCPIVYYNKKQDLIRLIKQESPINWKSVELSWTQAWNVWGNSTTLKVDTKDGKNPTSILEIQFHSTSRKNIVTRWYFENLLGVFKDNFSIVEL